MAASPRPTATAHTTVPTPALAGDESADSRSVRATPCDPSALPADTYCSELRNHRTPAGSGYGGAVCVAEESSFAADNLAFIDNTAAYGAALHALSAGDSIALLNARISGNVSATSAVRVFSTGTLALDSCTLAGNSGAAVPVSNAGATVSFDSSIIWSNSSGVTSSAAIVGNGCNISQNGVGGAVLDPLCTTTERGAYHLGASSPAVDACVAGPANDLGNRARPWGSAYDMGAFERWVVPDIFADGFESGSTSAWSNAVP